MMQNRRLALGVPLLVGLLYLGLRQETIEEPSASLTNRLDKVAQADRPASPATASPPAVMTPDVDPEIVAQLRSRYGANISHRYVQVKLIEALMRQYQKQDPEHWREKLLKAVRAAFPEHYEEIAKNLDRRVEYERWMKENRTRLEGLEPDARRAAIREEREQLFGKDAADEIWASEQKNQAVSETLKEVDGLQGKTIQEKLTTYTARLEEIYEEKYDTYLDQHRHEVMNRFLGLDSVQADLAGQSPADRSASLREIRKGMGLDDAALKRWDTLDQERDARWETGKKYMSEREALVGTYTGQTLEDKLAELRRRMFGDEADVIAAEEASGLFRFKRPRRWGQN